MKGHPNHQKSMAALKRIEGQVRGIQRMVEDGRYCVDILTQLSAVNSAISSVQDSILKRHLDTCVNTVLAGKSEANKKKKIDEILRLLKTFRKNS